MAFPEIRLQRNYIGHDSLDVTSGQIVYNDCLKILNDALPLNSMSSDPRPEPGGTAANPDRINEVPSQNGGERPSPPHPHPAAQQPGNPEQNSSSIPSSQGERCSVGGVVDVSRCQGAESEELDSGMSCGIGDEELQNGGCHPGSNNPSRGLDVETINGIGDGQLGDGGWDPEDENPCCSKSSLSRHQSSDGGIGGGIDCDELPGSENPTRGSVVGGIGRELEGWDPGRKSSVQSQPTTKRNSEDDDSLAPSFLSRSQGDGNDLNFSLGAGVAVTDEIHRSPELMVRDDTTTTVGSEGTIGIHGDLNLVLSNHNLNDMENVNGFQKKGMAKPNNQHNKSNTFTKKVEERKKMNIVQTPQSDVCNQSISAIGFTGNHGYAGNGGQVGRGNACTTGFNRNMMNDHFNGRDGVPIPQAEPQITEQINERLGERVVDLPKRSLDYLNLQLGTKPHSQNWTCMADLHGWKNTRMSAFEYRHRGECFVRMLYEEEFNDYRVSQLLSDLEEVKRFDLIDDFNKDKW